MTAEVVAACLDRSQLDVCLTSVHETISGRLLLVGRVNIADGSQQNSIFGDVSKTIDCF